MEQVLSFSRPYGVAPLMDRLIADARAGAESRERAEVAGEIRSLLAASGYKRDEFASRIGTSTSRLSTYLNGRVTPSAALMTRMRRVSEASAGHRVE